MKRPLLILIALVASACAQESRPQERREQRREERREQQREERRERRRHHRRQPPAVQPLTGPWSGILDPSRAVDWSQAGVIGGIPTNRTQCGSTITPSGLTDITDAKNINTALQGCGANTYLLLGPGTFNIVNGLTFGGPVNSNGFTTAVNNVTLRGSGADQTILRLKTTSAQDCGSYGSAVCIWGNNEAPQQYFYPYAGSCQWTAGYSQGSTQLTLGSCYNTTMPVPGQVIFLDQRNDDIGLTQCTSSGTTATCTVSTSTLPPSFVVGACVGVGGVNRSATMTGYNTHMMTPQVNPSVCNPITAVSGNTFSYTMSGGLSNQPQVGPCTAVQPWPSSSPAVNAANTTCGYAVVDTGGLMTTGTPCVTADGGGTDCVNAGLNTGRMCPDPQARNPQCQTGEISWRTQSQIVKITNVSGNVITVDTPLYGNNWRASQAPAVWWFTASSWMSGDGIEDMTLDARNDGGTSATTTVYIGHCYNCWVKGIRTIAGSRNHIWLQNGVAHTTVRDSYFFDTKQGATQSYGVEMWGQTASVLVENNIFIRVVAGVLAGGAYGNVVSYNYLDQDGYSTTGLMMPILVPNHDVNQYNLFESNNSAKIGSDNIHGTSSSTTEFRNRIRTQQSATPKLNSLSSTQVSSFNRGYNVIGDVLGTTTATNNAYQVVGSGSNCDSYKCIWNLGKTSQGGNTIQDDPLVQKTMYRWGNYDTVTQAVRWCGAGTEAGCAIGCTSGNQPSPIVPSCSEVPTGTFGFLNPQTVPTTHTLPPSFYLTSRPAFYGTKWGTPPWPSIGPDVTGGTACPSASCSSPGAPESTGDANGGGMVYQIPAGLANYNMVVDPNFVIAGQSATSATWSSTGQVYPAVTLTGTFGLPIYGTFSLSGMTPSTYNGVWTVVSLDGPTADAGSPNPSFSSGGSFAYLTYRIRFTRVNQFGETQTSGTIVTSPSSTCPTSGNCTLSISSPCIASGTSPSYSCSQNGVPPGNAQAATGYNVYINDKADLTGKFCRQNATPIALGTTYTQSTAIIRADTPATGTCIEPPTANTAVSKTLIFYLLNDPGGNGTCSPSCSVTSPLIGTFNANQFYYGATVPTPPSGITGNGKITGQGKII